jgi:hypothetical protein
MKVYRVVDKEGLIALSDHVPSGVHRGWNAAMGFIIRKTDTGWTWAGSYENIEVAQDRLEAITNLEKQA